MTRVKWLRHLVLMFIDAFGITHPSIEARDRAAKYIALPDDRLSAILCSVFLALKVLRV